MTSAPLDLRPAAAQLATLVRHVADDDLTAPTPCADFTVADLLDHIGGFATAFTWAATKASLTMPVVEPAADGSRLEPDWRTRIAADVLALGDAWTDPAAWTGMTRAGPFDMPGEVGGLVALDELVVHGWDLAAATGQPFTADDASVEGVGRFAAMFSGDEEERGSGFGRPIDVAPTAPALDRVLGLLGRDPTWTRSG